MTSSKRIAAPFGLCPDGRIERNPLIEIGDDGTVVSVEFAVSDIDSIPRAEYYNGILIPSMVNAHCHMELSHMRGQVPEGIGLTNFFGYVSAGSGKADFQSIFYQDKAMWKEGVSAVADVSGSDASLAVKADSHIYYRTFVEYYGHGCKGDVASYVDHKTGALLGKFAKAGLDAVPSPHSTYLVSPEAFAYASKVGVLYTHFMESVSERGFFEGEGEMYRYLKMERPYPYRSAADMLIRLLRPSTKLVLVHCTTITENDIVEIESFFDDVTYVLCPSSNYYIERTSPPATLLYGKGCKVAIGTDSLASNNSLSMAREISLLSKDNPSVPLGKILSWATAGGAAALGLEEKMGYFRKGSGCGVVLATGVDLVTMRAKPDLKLERIV